MRMGSEVLKFLEGMGDSFSQTLHGASLTVKAWLTAGLVAVSGGGDPRPTSTPQDVASAAEATPRSTRPLELKVRRPREKGENPEALPGKFAAFVKKGDQTFGIDADKEVDGASLTKILAAYVAGKAIREGKLREDEELTVSKHAATQTGSVLGLRVGQKIKVREALSLGLLESFNDAIVVVAEATERAYGAQPDPRDPAALEKAFAKRMTETAKTLGAEKTTAATATGLGNCITTAKDVLIIAAALKRDDSKVYALLKGDSVEYRGTPHKTHIQLLAQDRLEAAKTGTKKDNCSFYGDVGGAQYVLIGLINPTVRFRFATMYSGAIKAVSNAEPNVALNDKTPQENPKKNSAYYVNVNPVGGTQVLASLQPPKPR